MRAPGDAGEANGKPLNGLGDSCRGETDSRPNAARGCSRESFTCSETPQAALPSGVREPSEGSSPLAFPGVDRKTHHPLEPLWSAPSSLAATGFGGGSLGNRVGGDRSRAPKRFAQVIQEVAQEG